jgi:hypothetical protein
MEITILCTLLGVMGGSLTTIVIFAFPLSGKIKVMANDIAAIKKNLLFNPDVTMQLINICKEHNPKMEALEQQVKFNTSRLDKMEGKL